MAKSIMVEKILEKRDIDAALYLLTRLLGSTSSDMDARRGKLTALKSCLESSKHITNEQRQEVVLNYRQVIG